MQKQSPCPKTFTNALLNSQQLTFNPSIHSLNHSIYPSSRPLPSTKNIWESLTKDLRERNQQRQLLKAEAQQREISECHFGQLNPRDTSQTFDRLYQEAEHRKIEQQRREQEKLEKQNQISFQNKTPNTQKLNSQKIDLSPLYLRLEEVLKTQAQERRKAELSQPQPTFQPTIDPHSLLLQRKQNRISSIVDRLIDDHKQRQLRKQTLTQKVQMQRERQLTFTPKINVQFSCHPPTHKKEVANHDLEQFTFAPEINPLSQLLTNQRKHETKEQKLFRLSQAPIISKSQHLQELAEQHNQECSFNPQINLISKQLGAGTPPRHCCPRPQQQTPSHRPRINPTSASLTHLQRSKTCQQSRKKGERKAQQYMQGAEYEEMKECTFRPNTVDAVKARALRKAGSLTSVAGYQKFRMHRDKVKQKEKDRRQREEKVFNLEKNYDARKKRELYKKYEQ